MEKRKIFLASSSELKDDRQQFEIFISRKKGEWHDKGIFLELILCEDFLDAVSQTRLQDEYNKAIKESDIFLMLFCTKVGKYTEEEFDTAFKEFKANNKPFIFTYFKDAPTSTGSAIKKDMISMWAFQEKLDQLGHFYTRYKNTEELQLNFSQQLEKLWANDSIEFKTILDKVVNEKGAARLPKELTLTIPKTDPDDIVGREKDLEGLHELLYNKQKVVVVNGLGGIGKTTLAQAYLCKYYQDYQHIAWITQSSENIAIDFINDSGLISLLPATTTNVEPELLFEEIIRKMKAIAEKPNLLVIDNGEHSLGKYRNKLPRQPQWHLLITSREEITGFHPMPLDFLSKAKAIELFRKHYSLQKLTDQDIEELVELVDYHTLTIEILAKTAKVQRYDLSRLKVAIEQDLKANIEVYYSGEQSRIEKVGSYLGTVFNLSKLKDEELWLLKQFTCLPSDFLNFGLLEELLKDEQSLYHDSFAETLSFLGQKGWLLYNSIADNYKMHRIIAEVVKKQHPVCTDDVPSLIEALTQKLYIDHNKDNPVDKFIWAPFGTTLLNNVQESDAANIVELQINLARVLKYLGEYQEAKELLEKAVLTKEKHFGKDHPETAASYHSLALVFRVLGDYQEAKELLEKAVLTNEKHFGKDHPETAASYHSLANVLRVLGEYQEAKELLEKAVLTKEKHFGKDHPETAKSYHSLALVLRELGEYEEAKELLEKAVRLYEKQFGKDHPSTAKSYHSLALVLKNLGEYQEAKELLEKAVLTKEKHFGKDHPETAASYQNLARVLKNLGEYQQSKKLLEKAVRLYEKHFGKDHPETAKSYQSLALVLKNLGEYQQSKKLLEKAVLTKEKHFGKDHPETATSYQNLARVLKNLGEYEDALAFSWKAFTVYNKTLPEGHPSRETAHNNYQLLKDLVENYK
ncbi:tetratricopeptide repeat protein [Telluribacter sp.]|uniref:tetratricopeptide repeat protein n=1 Tax=Telluribacter sp. TaxID=1978767 RepID=UPI002E164B36|nr:tetratricopeptide repeat protein [Telluribacter sp.]